MMLHGSSFPSRRNNELAILSGLVACAIASMRNETDRIEWEITLLHTD